jgi:lipid-A-disaccharide synthase
VTILLKAPNVVIDNIPSDVIAIKEDHYQVLSIADAAIVCSGTATLETAILGCPMVVCYKLSSITWFLAQKMSSVKYLSLVNLISDKNIVKELLQNDMSANNITKQIIYLLSEEGQEKTRTDYRELISSLTSKTNPYKEAAKYILQ